MIRVTDITSVPGAGLADLVGLTVAADRAQRPLGLADIWSTADRTTRPSTAGSQGRCGRRSRGVIVGNDDLESAAWIGKDQGLACAGVAPAQELRRALMRRCPTPSRPAGLRLSARDCAGSLLRPNPAAFQQSLIIRSSRRNRTHLVPDQLALPPRALCVCRR